MAFDDSADNNSVPPKSCRPQEARESLPQSFHSLAVSEPDPITLFTPYILSVSSFSNDHANSASLNSPSRPRSGFFPVKPRENFNLLPFQVVTNQRKKPSTSVRIQCALEI